ncbi:MAG TPA: hypothetical protein VFU95_12750 [Telluria sp.]|nr:hypothetical protein [Telluria sp.]
MPSFFNTRKSQPQSTGRIERELERERQEHTMNQDAKQHLGDNDERLKDARETPFSSTVRRFK